MHYICFHILRWFCAIRVLQGWFLSPAGRSRSQWAALALQGPSDGSVVDVSSVCAEVVSEPVLLSLVPSSRTPSGTHSLSSDAPSSLPGWTSSSSEDFIFPEWSKAAGQTSNGIRRKQDNGSPSPSSPGMSALFDSVFSHCLLLLSLGAVCCDLLPCVAQMCFSSSAKTHVGASLALLSPASFSLSAIRLRAASSAAAISADIFSMSTSTFMQHSFKKQKGLLQPAHSGFSLYLCSKRSRCGKGQMAPPVVSKEQCLLLITIAIIVDTNSKWILLRLPEHVDGISCSWLL